MPTVPTVLHPTDFSEHSAAALDVACALAREQNARLVLLHVVPRTQPDVRRSVPSGLEPPVHTVEDMTSYRTEMQGRLARLAVPVNVPVERLLREGDVAPEILKAAEEVPCDLIVMGTHGRKGYARAVLGSVAAEVTHKATCRVLTVRAAQPEARPA